MGAHAIRVSLWLVGLALLATSKAALTTSSTEWSDDSKANLQPLEGQDAIHLDTPRTEATESLLKEDNITQQLQTRGATQEDDATENNNSDLFPGMNMNNLWDGPSTINLSNLWGGSYIMTGNYLTLPNYKGVRFTVSSPNQMQHIAIGDNTVAVNGKTVSSNTRALSNQQTYQKASDGAKWYTNLNVGQPMTTEEEEQFKAEIEERRAAKERKRQQKRVEKEQRQLEKDRLRRQKIQQKTIARREKLRAKETKRSLKEMRRAEKDQAKAEKKRAKRVFDDVDNDDDE